MQWFKIPAKTYFIERVKYLRDMYGIGGRHRVRQGHGAAGGRQDHRPLRARSNRVTASSIEPEPSVETRCRTRCRYDARGVRTGHHHCRRRWFPMDA